MSPFWKEVAAEAPRRFFGLFAPPRPQATEPRRVSIPTISSSSPGTRETITLAEQDATLVDARNAIAEAKQVPVLQIILGADTVRIGPLCDEAEATAPQD